MSALYRILANTDLPGGDVSEHDASSYAESEHIAAKHNALAFTYVPDRRKVYLKRGVPPIKAAPHGLVCISGIKTSPFDILANTDLPGSDVGAHPATTIAEAEAAAIRHNAVAFTWVPSRNEVYLKSVVPAMTPSPPDVYCLSGVRHAEHHGHHGGYHILSNTDFPGSDIGEAPAHTLAEAQAAAAHHGATAFTFVHKWHKVLFKNGVPVPRQSPQDLFCVSGVRHGQLF